MAKDGTTLRRRVDEPDKYTEITKGSAEHPEAYQRYRGRGSTHNAALRYRPDWFCFYNA
jgi:hypothetical protein